MRKSIFSHEAIMVKLLAAPQIVADLLPKVRRRIMVCAPMEVCSSELNTPTIETLKVHRC